MRTRVRAALERAGLRDATLVVAVSGGVDSSVLLELLASTAPALGVSLRVAHVHHGLRDDADEDAASVRRAALTHGLEYLEERIDPRAWRAGATSSRARPTLQEASRRLRYNALKRMAETAGAAAVATAHNRDDQVETVLLRTLRGTGPDGLSGMRAFMPWPDPATKGGSPALFRPLLDVSRLEILEFASAHRVSWREDASNSDAKYARNRMRERWLPGLREAFNPQLDRAIADLAVAMQEERDWLRGLEESEAASRLERLENGSLRIDIKEWEHVPVALARRLARRALLEMGVGRDITRAHLERMLGFLGDSTGGGAAPSGKSLELPGGLRLRREGRGASLCFRLERESLPPPGGC